MLKESDGDIIDFYGPCDYDPLGTESVAAKGFSISYLCANSVVATDDDAPS